PAPAVRGAGEDVASRRARSSRSRRLPRRRLPPSLGLELVRPRLGRADVAQLADAPASDTGEWGFESLHPHLKPPDRKEPQMRGELAAVRAGAGELRLWAASPS